MHCSRGWAGGQCNSPASIASSSPTTRDLSRHPRIRDCINIAALTIRAASSSEPASTTGVAGDPGAAA